MSTEPLEPHDDQPVPPPPKDDGFEYEPECSGIAPMAAEGDMVVRPRRK